MIVEGRVLYGLARLFRASHNDAVRSRCSCRRRASSPSCSSPPPRLCARCGHRRRRSSPAIVTVHDGADARSRCMLGRYLLKQEAAEELEEDFEGAGGNVLVIGFGRFGQILAQVLLARHVNATILDASAERVRQAARFGFRIYFGDGTRRDVLRAAGAEQASIICVCVDKADVANRIVDLVMHEFPGAKVYVRSWDRGHTLELLAKGVDYELRETFESALAFGAETLRGHRLRRRRGGRGRGRGPAPRCRPARCPAARRPGGGRRCRQAAGRDAGAALRAGSARWISPRRSHRAAPQPGHGPPPR